jgi:hypothetical protein
MRKMTNQIPTFACVLKMGGDYLPEHVQALAKQVKEHTSIPYEFVCYSDVEIEGVKTIPLLENYPGWWSVPEVFRQIGPTVITGIDTVIKGSLDPIFKIALESSVSDFWMIRAFNPRKKFASGIMVYNSDFSGIWDAFTYPDSVEKLDGEQDFTIQHLKKKGIIPNILQDSVSGIYSYKKHCRKRIPKDARVILFHGKPRPHEVPDMWNEIVGKYIKKSIPEIWPDSTVFILGGGPSLLESNLDLIKDKNVLGVNQAYKLGDWVDVNYSGDYRWYTWNRKELKKYKGLSITSYPTNNINKDIINVGRLSIDGISNKNNNSICWNGNSGASAINVAYWLGAKRIILLGFDMKRQGQKFNWHNDYPTIPGRKKNSRLKSPYRQFLKCWEQIKKDADKLGIQILNATPSGNLNIFPRVRLEETL